ncbi:hypothetical protein NLI96_g10824 [Meripilus lineatus]|uniref:Uncharacterized protein n=1 Tax=Meripilus lineatus TaxID=2056292 RepID=A0AAD5YDZ2_9APHY|nr:hypothetical protein NLI96_g10824 [Physisporinus lineatus]
MQVRSQPPSRPMVVTGSQPPPPIASSVSQQVPTQVQGYPIMPGLSPRVSTFRGGFPQYGHPSPLPVPTLSPSVLPRGFGVPVAPVDPQHTQVMPHQPPPPIAPPSKAVQNPLASPTQLAPGSRRSSAPAPDPGPITRPVPAPIARPAGDSTGSGSTSPSRRSPSPKGVLGSSALLSDEDEVVFANSRRTVSAIGPSWGSTASPRSAVTNERVPWGQAVGVHPPPGLSPRPPPWNNAAPGTDWHSPSAAYFGAAYGVHNPSPPPPHNGS